MTAIFTKELTRARKAKQIQTAIAAWIAATEKSKDGWVSKTEITTVCKEAGITYKTMMGYVAHERKEVENLIYPAHDLDDLQNLLNNKYGEICLEVKNDGEVVGRLPDGVVRATPNSNGYVVTENEIFYKLNTID